MLLVRMRERKRFVVRYAMKAKRMAIASMSQPALRCAKQSARVLIGARQRQRTCLWAAALCVLWQTLNYNMRLFLGSKNFIILSVIFSLFSGLVSFGLTPEPVGAANLTENVMGQV